MADPHLNMSPAADLVMAVVMIVLLVAWLGLVYSMARKPYWDRGGHGEGNFADARRPRAVTHGRDVPAKTAGPGPDGQPARDGATDEPRPRGAGHRG